MNLKSLLLKLLLKALLAPFTWMPKKSSPLFDSSRAASNADQEIASRIAATISLLSLDIGERNIRRLKQLQQAESFIAERLRLLGYTLSADAFEHEGVQMRNVAGEKNGNTREIVIVGAHYDTVFGSPGADDNASGVAVMLELARLFAAEQTSRRLRFVAFANEENQGAPSWNSMGSYHYASACAAQHEKISAMISLEMLGYYSSAPGSQRYPKPFNLLYPDRGDFLGFVGNWRSRRLIRRAIKTFRTHSSLPSQGIAAPSAIRDVNRSDHWAFGQFGYPAIMVTDTANFRNPHYHSNDDLPETLDLPRLVAVTFGLREVIRSLLNED